MRSLLPPHLMRHLLVHLRVLQLLWNVVLPLYMDKINAPGNEGSLKCIHSGSNWYSPIEFEILGVRLKSRNWRRSIMHSAGRLPLFNWYSSWQAFFTVTDHRVNLNGGRSRLPTYCWSSFSIYQSLQATWWCCWFEASCSVCFWLYFVSYCLQISLG